jgi:hypothetical protein
MSTTPSLVDVYHHTEQHPPHTGVMRVFVNGFGHDLHFRPKAEPGTGLELQIDAVELEATHLGALLQALRKEESNPPAITGSDTSDAPGKPSAATVQIINHTTKSGLSTGALRLHADTLRATDLPYHEHVSRNGHLVLQLHRVTLDAPLLAGILAALQREELRLRKGREVFQRAASNLLMMSVLEDDDGPP